jgi:uncharacterized protein with HEPN domain
MRNFCDKVDFILDRINIIEKILLKVKITEALEDGIILRPAILMHLMQIGESLNSLNKKAPNLIKKYDLIEDIKGAYNVRNFIAHDYEGINLAIIESILRYNLKDLKNKLKELKNECK